MRRRSERNGLRTKKPTSKKVSRVPKSSSSRQLSQKYQRSRSETSSENEENASERKNSSFSNTADEMEPHIFIEILPSKNVRKTTGQNSEQTPNNISLEFQDLFRQISLACETYALSNNKIVRTGIFHPRENAVSLEQIYHPVQSQLCDASCDEEDHYDLTDSQDNSQNAAVLKTNEKTKKNRKLLIEDVEEHVVTPDNKYKCKICAKTFMTKNYLKIHNTKHTGAKPFACLVCDKSFASRYFLKIHELSHASGSQGVVKPFSCDICGKAFFQKGSLEIHQRIHTGEKPYPCPSCPHRFSCKSDLRRHERAIHSENMPYQCQLCSSQFKTKTSLERHEKNHTGEKSFICSICSKAFSTRGDLKSHEKRHTNERPYLCSFCFKRFNFKSYLEKHEKIHTGEKPFSCSTCGKTFGRHSTLKRHQLIHSGEKPFICSICSKRFSDKRALKNHELGHKGEKPFTCDVCFKGFVDKSHLSRHEKIHFEKPYLSEHTHAKININEVPSSVQPPFYEAERIPTNHSQIYDPNRILEYGKSRDLSLLDHLKTNDNTDHSCAAAESRSYESDRVVDSSKSYEVSRLIDPSKAYLHNEHLQDDCRKYESSETDSIATPFKKVNLDHSQFQPPFSTFMM